MRTCKTVSRKPCINREAKSRKSQLSYSVTVVETTMKLLAVVKPPSSYNGFSTQKMFLE